MSDDRLEQERRYNERGMNDTEAEANNDNEDEDDDSVTEDELGGDNKKKILIVAGIAVALVLVIIVGLFVKEKVSGPSQEDKDRVAKYEQAASDEEPDNGEVSDPDDNGNITLDKPEETDEDAVPITDEDVKELRSYGYTGDEIEQAKIDGVSASYMIKEAKKSMDERLKEEYTEIRDSMLDSGSEDYKNLIELTWLNGENVEVKPEQGGDEKSYSKYSTRENVRYVKVPAHGNQLFIQLTLKDRDPIYFNVSPQKYWKLDQEGNMVISYTVYEFGGKEYITTIKEVSID